MRRFIDRINTYEEIKDFSDEELIQLADEIREFLKESICRTGGHLGVNTGVVELTIALHYVFDSLKDKFIWDVGHNVYVHKILTGRADLLHTLRQDEGSPGFPTKNESDHDVLDTSHGGTSLSIAAGIAISNRIQNVKGLPIAIIGDSALGEGMALEALNHIGYEKPDMLVIVNDNGWGITENETAIKSYLGERKIGSELSEGFFTSLGFSYNGPVDGHDLDCLVNNLNEIKQNHKGGPIILHVKTQKGNGLDFPKDEITNHHFCFPLDKSGNPITEDIGSEEGIFYKPLSPFNAGLVGKKIDQLIQDDPKMVLITPATQGASETLTAFNSAPNRSFDVGMAEQHALTLGVGFSLQGMKPVISYQSTFFQRSYDQLVHDVCVNNIPILIILARSGLAGLDHMTHHATLDLSYLTCIPNLEILFPPNHEEFNSMLEEKLEKWVSGPTIMMNPYGTIEMLETDQKVYQKSLDTIFDESNDGIIITTGGFFKKGIELREQFKKLGSDWGIKNLTKIAPISHSEIIELLDRYNSIIVLEENVSRGGLGSSILEIANDYDYDIKMLRINLGKAFTDHGTREYLHSTLEIDIPNIIKKAKLKWPHLIS
jgi:1-deoxy-D-xylulose-5-phosphate synthase